ncbi:MAG: GNAT family N-acetyltransferase [Ferrimicrobium sp.]|uniref:GNAT family N-acetyltransferase n=1 Tax=Ferrimicrobium acidiphilum TaxID=121039 RepID=A0ABV3Y5D9_9ACTN|nr:GNAT family N-acetyltransferase [Ferrimicrobium sp.]MDA8400385.1 GNAT family N-acetyltransferase [Actinomycetota bacterium]
MLRYLPYERTHLFGIIAICQAEGWSSFSFDPERAHRTMTAPGVTTVVADVDGAVVGFACLQSDGETQAHLSLIAVDAKYRRQSLGRSLISKALAWAGGQRVDLITDTAEAFYSALPHRRFAGFRIYPPFDASKRLGRGELVVRNGTEVDENWVADVLHQRWGSPMIVSRGRSHDVSRLSTLVAEVDGERLGLATYHTDDEQVELVTLDALLQGRGIGSALLLAVNEQAVSAGCRRLWLVTSNDKLDAIRFYQRRGMRIVGVHRGAIDEARQLKPTIPEVGNHAIPIHDEIEFEVLLDEREHHRSVG